MTGASKPPTELFLYTLKSAYAAMHQGDKRAAYRLAQKAIAIDPRREEPWLILAAVASPRGSLYYLKQALKINPQSEPALTGLKWALKRLPPTLVATPLPSQPRFDFKWQFTAIGVILIVCMLVWTQTSHKLSPSTPPQIWLPPTLTTPDPSATPTAYRLPATQPAELSSTPTKLYVATATPVQQLPSATPQNTQAVPQPTDPHAPSATAPPPTDPPAPSATAPLPTDSPAPSATAQPQQPSTVYVVQSGDTLFEIARRFNVSVQAITAENSLINPSRIDPNQKITIPGVSSSKNAGAQQSEASGPSQPKPSANQGKHILVDISEQTLYAYEGENLVYTFSVSTGRSNTTLTGSFKILDKDPNAWSYPWGFWMPDWMGIYYVGYDLENGIHSLPVLTNGETIWGDQIGTPISYGCVVLRPEDSHQLFSWAEIGTPIEIQP